jgi:Trp operon repressor
MESKALENELLRALQDVKGNERLLGDLLQEILTPAELQALRRRWKIMRLLHAGHTQRQVARMLRCSLCNVTRGARVLKRSDSLMRRILDAHWPAC